MNHPIRVSDFNFLTYSGAENYLKTHYLFWFKNQWRNLVSFKVIENNSRGEVNVMLVEFSGLKPRKIQIGTCIFYTFQADMKAVSENRWFGQKNGPSFWEGVDSFQWPRGMTYENPEWLKEMFKETRGNYCMRYLERIERRKNNEAFFKKRYERTVAA